MIWNPYAVEKDERSDAVSHIVGKMSELCDDDSFCDDYAEEIAKAVEVFIDQEGDCAFAESGQLMMLASRALSSMGESKKARRMLIFGTGLVKPSEWVVSGDSTMWVLDLKQVTVSDSLALELVFFNSLSVILGSIAEVWDGTMGEGTLGLRNVCSSVVSIVGERDVKKAGAKLVKEIIGMCESRLKKISSERGWQSTPQVMNLDI